MEILIIWLLFLVAGIALGQSKDQLIGGIIWTFFFGPIGLIVVACLPNRRHQADLAKQQALLSQQLSFQKRQLDELQALRQQTKSTSPNEQTIRIKHGGQRLDAMKLAVAQAMLNNGQLSIDDLYFDSKANDWLPLECHPAFIR
jgi:hypothetical protein